MGVRKKKNLTDVKESGSYDVKTARKKIKNYIPPSRYRNRSGQTSNASFERNGQFRSDSKDSIEDHTSYTSSNEFSTDNISRLDNRLTNYETHNTEAHDNLRKELETKIEIARKNNAKEIEKAEKRCFAYVDGKTKESKFFTYFKWILGIAVPLLLAWFANSYNKTSNKVFENEKHLLKIENKVNNMQRQKNDSIEHKK